MLELDSPYYYRLKAFQEFSKSYNGTIILIFFVPLLPVSPIVFSSNLNEILILLSLAGKSIMLLLLPRTGLLP